MNGRDRMKRATLHTLGCRLNQAETAHLAGRLKTKGYRLVEFGEPTDLLVLNTCSVTQDAERDSRRAVRSTLRHSPKAFVAVTGCYAQTGVEALQGMDGIDMIVGSQFKMTLPDLLPSPEALSKPPSPHILHSKRIAREEFVLDGTVEFEGTRATLKIQDGCDVMCSFCIIPLARGRSRSRALSDVLREGGELVAKGYKELVLSGVNIGEYESGGAGLVDLIKLLELLPGIERIRISSIEPTTVTAALLDHMARSNRLCRHLHIPLQSGSDTLLTAMNRPYTVTDFTGLIELADRLIPDVCIGTDLLVGFPGEQPEQHEATISLVSALPIAYFHVFPYSARPSTPAAKMAAQVRSATITERTGRLTELSRAKRVAYYQRFLGHRLPVLFERPGRKGRRIGFTDNYLRVQVSGDEDLTNVVRAVEITAVQDGLALGHLVSSRPDARTPLPLLAEPNIDGTICTQ